MKKPIDEQKLEAAETTTPSGEGLLGGVQAVGRASTIGGNGTFGDFIGKYAVVFVFLAMIIGFSIALSDTFFTATNFQTIAGQQAVAGLIALALLTTLIAGDFDLSIGATLTIASTVVIGLQIDQGFSWPAAVAVAIGIGAVIGLINSIAVVRFGINSLIATLAVGTIIDGVVNWQTGGKVIYGDVAPTFAELGRWELFGTPGSVFYLLAIALVLWFVFSRTVFGRYLFATGSNPDAARLSGVETDGIRTLAFVITGVIAAIAGVLFAANVGSGQPGVGAQFLLPAFAATFLGATTIVPGRFNVWGTLIAVYLLGVGLAGLQQSGAPFYAEPIFNGAALLVAVGLSTVLRRKRER
ncbi:MAG: ABC transporter permease [Actinomycetota bacterium]|nr:ABC transporter permease [Actinomycetota bacterium]